MAPEHLITHKVAGDSCCYSERKIHPGETFHDSIVCWEITMLHEYSQKGQLCVFRLVLTETNANKINQHTIRSYMSLTDQTFALLII